MPKTDFFLNGSLCLDWEQKTLQWIMNSSSRSHCSCCQSWDNKGPWCAADLNRKGSNPFYQGFHGEHLCLLSCHTSRKYSSRCPSLHQGKKRAVPHGHKSLFVSHSQVPNTSASILDSCLYHRQYRTMKHHWIFKMCTVPITHLTVQGMVPLSLKLQQHYVTSKQTLF